MEEENVEENELFEEKIKNMGAVETNDCSESEDEEVGLENDVAITKKSLKRIIKPFTEDSDEEIEDKEDKKQNTTPVKCQTNQLNVTDQLDSTASCQ